jgi:hypothetical protein
MTNDIAETAAELEGYIARRRDWSSKTSMMSIPQPVIERTIVVLRGLATQSPASLEREALSDNADDDLAYVKQTLVMLFEKRSKLRDGVLASRINIAAHRLEDARRKLTTPPSDHIASPEGEEITRVLKAELDRQCSIGAGSFHVEHETGLWELAADIDPNGLRRALLRALATPSPAQQSLSSDRERLARTLYTAWYKTLDWDNEQAQRDIWYRLADAVLALGVRSSCGTYGEEPTYQGCHRPPEGWWCSRPFGHEGPCPTRRLGEM